MGCQANCKLNMAGGFDVEMKCIIVRHKIVYRGLITSRLSRHGTFNNFNYTCYYKYPYRITIHRRRWVCSRTFKCIFWIFLLLVSWIFLMTGWTPLYIDRVNSSLGNILIPKGNKAIPRPRPKSLCRPMCHHRVSVYCFIEQHSLIQKHCL